MTAIKQRNTITNNRGRTMTTGKQLKTIEPSKEALAISAELKEVIGYNPIEQIYEIGNRVAAVQQWLQCEDVGKILENLEGSPAGFLTDMKNGQKYAPKIRAQAIADVLSQGAMVVGNEFNIISGKGMLVKNYYNRMLDCLGHESVPSHNCAYKMIKWLSSDGEPEIGKGIIKIPMKITATLLVKSTNKKEDICREYVITLRYGGAYDTIDNSIGKAERRSWKKFYQEFSGIYIDDTVSDVDVQQVTEEPKTGKVSNTKTNASDAIFAPAQKAEPKPEPKTEPTKAPAPTQPQLDLSEANPPPPVDGDVF